LVAPDVVARGGQPQGGEARWASSCRLGPCACAAGLTWPLRP